MLPQRYEISRELPPLLFLYAHVPFEQSSVRAVTRSDPSLPISIRMVARTTTLGSDKLQESANSNFRNPSHDPRSLPQPGNEGTKAPFNFAWFGDYRLSLKHVPE